jgi:HSP20 family molecular chaperone IbpA
MTTNLIRWTPTLTCCASAWTACSIARSPISWRRFRRGNLDPPLDAGGRHCETTDALVLSAELPGLTWDDVQTPREQRADDFGERGGEGREERTSIASSVLRLVRAPFTVPGNPRHDQVQANFENGVLMVTLPKAEKPPRKIVIK